jgi:PAS domain S-box-containing protein
MDILGISTIIASSATLVVVCVYAYLYLQYRQYYLGLWVIGWLIHFIRVFFAQIPLPNLDSTILFEYVLLVILSSVLLLQGTHQFLDIKQSKQWWLLAFIMSIITGIIWTNHVSFFIKALITCTFTGAIYFYTGILYLWYLNIKGWGKHITGLSFIFFGIHTIDLPFFIDVEWFAPWGYLLDGILKLAVALGTLIVYFEKTRNDLEIKEQYYRLLAENATDVIYRLSLFPAPHLEYISPSIAKLLDYSPEEVYTMEDITSNLIHSTDCKLLKMSIVNSNAKSQPITFRLIRRDQSLVWVEQTYTPLNNSTGELIGYEGIIRDISSRKALEQDFSRLERLNAVGEMAASVAHEIRNPMTTIRGYIQLFSQKKEFTHYKDQMYLLLDELDRTNQIIKEYLALSKNKIVDFKLTELNHIVSALYPLMQADAVRMNKDIHLNLGDLPKLYLDENEIRQLLLNLVRNGLEEMQDKGVITISTFADSYEAVLAVTDQGGGIPDHILETLGQPFVTTKETGTGLGLATCYRIAHRHQAKIDVKTSRQGTTFFTRFQIPKV